MNWLSKLLFQRKVRSNKLEPAPAKLTTAAQGTEGKRHRPDLRIELLSLRYEHLMVLVGRWPTNEKDLSDWDRVAERAKIDNTNAISAASELGVEFTITFWQLLLSNAIWNLDACSLTYLSQQASLFYLIRRDGRFEEEAGLICAALISIRKWMDWPPDKPFELDDCQVILELAETLSPSEDRHVLALLGFVVNHTVAIPSFRHKIEHRQFWDRLIPLLERSATNSGNEASISAINVARGVLQWNWNLQGHVIQLSSNSATDEHPQPRNG
ncbi:hypothetical protein XI06_07310 [Bradyrhizobium sp. CCBAU 11434]|uniref:hypothetical protein n=1 Tax=Bradyrhizobium sp. CCBAU 11434 TaxID=1630885 RepID=UPI00230602FB|nr:hypothetical protein [Bradyrhizobium sp. CCBAU 11434]MDA9520163.1 hypothetical protein [Bradyrhizobium sp. CCBAU 11434]